ncbi:DUF1641 domain-containing protein [Ureibacillus composti]|uniref:DUF1641 domain-containing protein n=1 Tax=Lysinibacillus composti TaxID=720633 RepID=A0A3N9UBL9_9BACI|nr:DUF1641 domain-containing protein [Lysinibacillus composti]MBM7609558.1 uncharacterized protein YjgD (DUF1641 family) [Lysinibacillus composti]MDM5335441.1 DUF1641 domain-containing protein [Ureibacillus composti]RQW73899.1 DUF1641 domain-containing protein [Lysinibacillus composti]
MAEELVTQTQSEATTKQDLLDQLLKPEVQDSLSTLVEQLPKLAEVVTLLTKAYDYAQLVSTDEVLKSDTVSALKEVAEPVIGSVKNVAATAIEAKDRAEASNEAIGLFGLLKLLKDPEAQKLFRFANAFLQVTAERKNQE